MKSSGQSNDRIFGLDILRTISILYVVYGHGYCFLERHISSSVYFFPVFFDGVTSFFVLSGFLIGGIILRLIEKNNLKSLNEVRAFWIRRWFRTLPNYYFILLFLIFQTYLNFGYLPEGFNWKYFLFIQNFSSAHPAFFPEAWSLCVEEWFYLLFPLLFLSAYLLLKNSRSAVLCTIILFLAVPFILRTVYHFKGIGTDSFDENYRKVLLFRLDSIVYGVIGAYVYQYYPGFWTGNKNKLLITGLALLVLPRFAAIPPIYSLSYETICILLCRPWLSCYKSCSLKAVSVFFTQISIISYSMYLLNFTPVLHVILPVLKSHFHLPSADTVTGSIQMYFIYWSITIFASFVLYTFYERRMTGLRDKL